ncbi:MAG: aspartyl-phosphate phosphatase Spo0E family protein [Epulopiscium sp.]|nr:aspartyl-phosphate phosphatase Spo0E family protein [Candidatus Epulonipiscium sp.]
MNSIYGEIDILREKLNQLIVEEEDFQEIYKLSTELDRLILLYYDFDVYNSQCLGS